MCDHHDQLRHRLYATFRGNALPALVGEGFAVPAASLWSGARLRVGRFRELGLRPGDRVGLGLPPSPEHIMVTIACWWEGLTVCPASTGPDALDADESTCLAEPGVRVFRTRAVDAGASVGGTRNDNRYDAVAFPGRSSGEAQRMRSITTWQQLAAVSARCCDSDRWRGQDRCVARCWGSRRAMLGELWPALFGGAIVRVPAADDIHHEATQVRGVGVTPGGS